MSLSETLLTLNSVSDLTLGLIIQSQFAIYDSDVGLSGEEVNQNSFPLTDDSISFQCFSSRIYKTFGVTGKRVYILNPCDFHHQKMMKDDG